MALSKILFIILFIILLLHQCNFLLCTFPWMFGISQWSITIIFGVSVFWHRIHREIFFFLPGYSIFTTLCKKLDVTYIFLLFPSIWVWQRTEVLVFPLFFSFFFLLCMLFMRVTLCPYCSISVFISLISVDGYCRICNRICNMYFSMLSGWILIY